MYCKKLSNILHNNDSKLYGISLKDIQKLDYFIKNKTTFKERDNINVSRFSIEMDIDLNKAIRLFMIGVDEYLFSLVMYVECDNPHCDETYKIEDLYSQLECDCGKNIKIAKENVDIYFNLLETPTECNLDNQENISVFGLIMGKPKPSKIKLSDIEKVVGNENIEKAINKSSMLDRRLLKHLHL